MIVNQGPRQPGVQGLRFPYIPIQRQIVPQPGATILHKPNLIRGVSQPNMGLHPGIIGTAGQQFGIAGVPTAIALQQPMMHQANLINTTSAGSSQMTPKEALIKGTNFFMSIITKAKKTSLINLIQDLIDGRKTSEEFASTLQKELNSCPQPQLVPFLDLLLPHLRQSMNAGQTILPGIRPPNQQIASTSMRPGDVAPSSSLSQPLPGLSSMSQPSSQTPTTASSPGLGPPPAKKKKVPLPPGQKSAYAIKKEAREARKREKEREAAAMNIKIEGSDDGQKGTMADPRSDKLTTKTKTDKPKYAKQKKQDKQLESLSSALRDDDDVNDVAAMGGVNLAEESQKIMASGAELVGTQIRSCKDEPFFDTKILAAKIGRIVKEHNLSEPSNEIVTYISHATQVRLKDLVERLNILAEHRSENLRLNPKYEVSYDIKGQMKFLAELDRIEKRRYEEQERELLLKVAKSRSKAEDPEQQKLRQKAKDMQRAEQEEVRQREANQTALLAIGPRKKMKTSSSTSSISSFSQSLGGAFGGAFGGGGGGGGGSGGGCGSSTGTGRNLSQESKLNSVMKTDVKRIRRVNMKDLQVLFELDRMYLNRLVKISAQ